MYMKSFTPHSSKGITFLHFCFCLFFGGGGRGQFVVPTHLPSSSEFLLYYNNLETEVDGCFYRKERLLDVQC